LNELKRVTSAKALLESMVVTNMRLNGDDYGDGPATIMVEYLRTIKRLLSVSLEGKYSAFVSLGQDHHPSLRSFSICTQRKHVSEGTFLAAPPVVAGVVVVVVVPD
jgi:hypothetical protein